MAYVFIKIITSFPMSNQKTIIMSDFSAVVSVWTEDREVASSKPWLAVQYEISDSGRPTDISKSSPSHNMSM